MEYNKKNFLSNATWMMVNRIYSMLITLIVGSLTARYLGPSNYGLINYGTSIISFFSTISALGFSYTLVVDLVKEKEKNGVILGTALFLRLIISVVSFCLIYFIVSFLEPDNNQLIVVTMLQAVTVILNSYEIFMYWFQMRLEMRIVTIASMVALTVTAIWRVSLLVQQASIEFFALTNSITALVTGICIIFFFLRADHPNMCFSIECGKGLLKSSYHFIITGIAITLYTQIDRIMIAKFYDVEQVGYYSAAATIATLWEFVPVAIINSARPILTDIKRKDEYKYLENYKILLLAINVIGLFAGVMIILFGKLVVFILYGKTYLAAISPLMILIWATSFSMIGTARTIWMVSEDKNKYAKYYIFTGAVVNFILNFIFIPRWGIIGASVTTLISEIVVAVIAPYFYKETKEFCELYFRSFLYIKVLLSMTKSILKSLNNRINNR